MFSPTCWRCNSKIFWLSKFNPSELYIPSWNSCSLDHILVDIILKLDIVDHSIFSWYGSPNSKWLQVSKVIILCPKLFHPFVQKVSAHSLDDSQTRIYSLTVRFENPSTNNTESCELQWTLLPELVINISAVWFPYKSNEKPGVHSDKQ